MILNSERRRKALYLAFRIAAALLGITTLILLLRTAGTAEVASSFKRALPWLPLIVLIEGGRIGAELLVTRLLLGAEARRIPLTRLLRTHLIAYSVAITMPAGRPACEATKAALFAPYVGTARALAMAAANQGLNLMSEATLSLFCLIAAYHFTGLSPLTLALMLHLLICSLSAIAVQLAMRSQRLAGFIGRRRWLKAAAPDFRRAVAEQPVFLPWLTFLGGKSLQIALFALLFHAIGAEPRIATVLLAQGLNSLALAVGDLVPAQLGTTDGVFALGAASIGVSVGLAVSATMMFHCVQLLWVTVGALVPLFWPIPESSAKIMKACWSSPLEQLADWGGRSATCSPYGLAITGAYACSTSDTARTALSLGGSAMARLVGAMSTK